MNRPGRSLAQCVLISASAPFATVFVGALPVDDGIRSFLLPAALIFVVWPTMVVASVVFSALRGVVDYWIPLLCALTLSASIVSLIAAHEWTPIGVLFEANEAVHFMSIKPEYDREIGAAAAGHPQVRVFLWEIDWGGVGDGIVFDEKDHLYKPKSDWPSTWSRIQNGPNSFLNDICSTRPLWSHYYYVTFSPGCS